MQICPACRWPARTRSNETSGSRSTIRGKWQRSRRNIGIGIDKLVRSGTLRPVALRVDADDRDLLTTERDRHGVVLKQRRPFEVAKLSGP